MYRTRPLILAFFFAYVLTGVAICAEPAKVSDTAIKGAFREYEKIADRYGIEITLTTPQFSVQTVTGKEADPKNVSTFLALFSAEWSFYPPELVAQSGLRRIRFCKGLAIQGHPVGGTGGGGEKGDELYVDVGQSRWSKIYTRTTIHHEFFHVVDRRMHINAGDRSTFNDARWETLNEENFKYSSRLSMAGDLKSTVYDRGMKGFLNKYSQSAVEEDKAVLYSYMVTAGQIVDERTKTDPVLKAKTERMKTLVKDFCPQMDDEFWKNARKVTRLGG